MSGDMGGGGGVYVENHTKKKGRIKNVKRKSK